MIIKGSVYLTKPILKIFMPNDFQNKLLVPVGPPPAYESMYLKFFQYLILGVLIAVVIFIFIQVIQMLRRKDLRFSRLFWFIIMVIIPSFVTLCPFFSYFHYFTLLSFPFATMGYLFAEKRKRKAIYFLILILVLLFLFFLKPIVVIYSYPPNFGL